MQSCMSATDKKESQVSHPLPALTSRYRCCADDVTIHRNSKDAVEIIIAMVCYAVLAFGLFDML